MKLNTDPVIKKLLLVFLVIAGLYFGRAFLIPLAIATLMATLLLPFCIWLERKRIPRIVSAFIAVIFLLVIIGGVASVLGWQIKQLSSDVGIIKQKLSEAANYLHKYIFTNFGITIEKQNQLLNSEKPFLTGLFKEITGSLSLIVTNFFLVIVYILLLIYYRTHILQFLLKLFTSAQQEQIKKIVYSVAGVSQQYLSGLSKMIACLWVMYGIGFSILGIKHALFFAFLCGLLEIVPFIGNITGTTITVLVAAVQGASFPLLFGIVATYAVIQFIQGWVLEPLIVGLQVKINPLFTIIALVVGGLLWGIAGVFLAIPLMAMVKIVCDNIDPLKPYGFLIGEIKKKENS